jgi:hypothetical protein
MGPIRRGPKSPYSAPACRRWPNSRHRAGHTSSAHTTSMPTCRREPSHCLLVSCSVASMLSAALMLPVAAPAGMPAPGARRRSLAPPAPLAELTRPKARCLGPCVALLTRARSWVGAVCWHPSLRRVDTWMPPLSSSPSDARCRCASTSHERVPNLSLCRRTEPCRPRCSHARHDYKRRPSHCFSFTLALLSASGKPPPSRLTSASATPSMPSRLTHFLSSCVGP